MWRVMQICGKFKISKRWDISQVLALHWQVITNQTPIFKKFCSILVEKQVTLLARCDCFLASSKVTFSYKVQISLTAALVFCWMELFGAAWWQMCTEHYCMAVSLCTLLIRRVLMASFGIILPFLVRWWWFLLHIRAQLDYDKDWSSAWYNTRTPRTSIDQLCNSSKEKQGWLPEILY
jgi:hypothetical protein